ncbi:sodium:solute symporter [Blastopirellula sp. JC732]|uniref:Sodium:solute symporter n=1 Tax=Blastopirellula sediminis TaxID=2894196 RepID=A0A9X1MKK4_9BACT|nr:sodium:solute symporter [Blastopirellula sediminis]MCC9608947.1 sodium:solute symporter [Blastopirellula sediminis]MCC9628276.1 sodium:solute symporter [Blastopirellula sediminis]
MPHFSPIDVGVLVLYLVCVVGLGAWFYTKSSNPDGYMAASRSMSGWVVGLSIFGTYVSSISFIALPGKAFSSNWNAIAFSISLPIAAWAATRWFVPYYRQGNAVSAYEHLEKRFGTWARTYAAVCYLLTQVARMGSVMYLLALPLHQLLGWNIPMLILVTGGLTTLYTLLGGIEGVIWTDALQSVVLATGAIVCAILIPLSMPEGPGQLMTIAAEHHKFSLGSMQLVLTEPTFWVVLVYGLFINLQNFGIDQSYIQRYIAAKSDGDARRSVWLGALVYVPISILFLWIGTSLFAYYGARPELLPPTIQAEIAKGNGDGVFPFFIVAGLPVGVSGLLVAAIFAAAMSTLSTSLNGAATLTLADFYKRFYRPDATEKESMVVLYVSTLLWGVIGTSAALALMEVKSILDAWWKLAGIFSGGMLGLFLLGFLSQRTRNLSAILGVTSGVLVILWMTLSHMPIWPAAWADAKSPFDSFLTTVFGTLAILLVGFALTQLLDRSSEKEPQSALDQPREPQPQEEV